MVVVFYQSSHLGGVNSHWLSQLKPIRKATPTTMKRTRLVNAIGGAIPTTTKPHKIAATPAIMLEDVSVTFG